MTTKFPKKLKAAIFDMDGTIIDTRHAWKQITEDSLQQCGIYSVRDEQKKQLNTIAGGGAHCWAAGVINVFNLDIKIDSLVEHVKYYSSIRLKQSTPFIEGFESFHSVLKRNQISSSVATNAFTHYFDILKNKMNLGHYFDNHLYCVDHVDGKAKPDPAVFLLAAEKLGAQPEECVVFEDTISGFKAAKAAGMKCIGIRNPRNLNTEPGLVHEFIDNYDEAEAALHKLFDEAPQMTLMPSAEKERSQ
ncbi:HAD family phosphatase [bacterium]|nr:HAD family phosphatase [bacterium]